jgi:hypothetical protein
MYRIFVAAAEFQGKRTIQQHRIINDVSNFFVKKFDFYVCNIDYNIICVMLSRKAANAAI